MSHAIEERDSQHATTMAWHGKTEVTKVLEKDSVYPYEVRKDYLYRNLGKTKHGEYFTPICSDDDLPIGQGPCLNYESYALLSPKEFWDNVEETIDGTKHKIISAGSEE